MINNQIGVWNFGIWLLFVTWNLLPDGYLNEIEVWVGSLSEPFTSLSEVVKLGDDER